MVEMIADGLFGVTAKGLIALHLHLRSRFFRGLRRAVEKNLQVGFRNDAGAVHQGVADLNGVFAGGRVVGLRGKVEAGHTLIVLHVALVLVAQGKGVLLPQLQVEARAYIGAALRRKQRVVELRSVVVGGDTVVAGREISVDLAIQPLRADDGVLLNIAVLRGEKERSVLADRAAHRRLILVAVISRQVFGEWIAGVELLGVALHVEVAMQFVGTRLGEDLDAAKAQLVELRSVWILIDANLTDRGFRRKLAGREAVNVDLAARRSGAWTGKGGEFIGELIGIVRESVQIFALDDHAVCVCIRIDGNRGRIRVDVHRLLRHLDEQRRIEHLA